MSRIALPEGSFGMRSLLEYRPDTGKAILGLAQAVLQGDSPLSPGEREAIAAHVAELNQCEYCRTIHGWSAADHLGCSLAEVRERNEDAGEALPAKTRAFLALASEVARGGHAVSDETVAAAREHGATDREIHDVVIVAALMSMATRYVDGLKTGIPDDPAFLEQAGRRIAKQGYVPTP